MKLFLSKGQGIDLPSDSFLTQGGEGSIYVHQNNAYKIYRDPKLTLPAQKLKELSCLNSSTVIVPQQLIFDTQGQAVGYQMRFVPHAVPLCKLFNSSYKSRHRVDDDMLLSLFEQLRRGVLEIHRHGILLVDLNDQNFLISSDHQSVYFVDVDSYQTPHFPATALMDSVRDWNAPRDQFSKETDWFSFAVVSFQLLIGIHPYKGKHPTVQGLIQRMKHSISVFDPQVSVPSICPPLTTLTPSLYHWFKRVFQEGYRGEAPHPNASTQPSSTQPSSTQPSSTQPSSTQPSSTQPSSTQPSSRGNPLRIKRLLTTPTPIRGHSYSRGTRVLLLDDRVWIDGEVTLITHGTPIGVLFERKSNEPVIVCQIDHTLSLFNPQTGQTIGDSILADQTQCVNHRLHTLYHGRHSEVEVRKLGHRLISVTTPRGVVMKHATTLFSGGMFQNMLGSFVFIGLDRHSPLSSMRLPELDKKRVIDAHYQGYVLIVLYRTQLGHSIARFRFDSSGAYVFDQMDHTDMDNVGFVTTQSGVAVWLRSTGSLEVFHSQGKQSGERKILNALRGDEHIFIEDGRVVITDQTHLYALSLG